MSHRSILVISLLALASCQATRYSAPRLLGSDLTTVKFHGRLSTSPLPLQPEEHDGVSVEECRDAAAPAASGLLRVDVHAISVPREWVDNMFALQTEKRPLLRPGGVVTTHAHNAQVLTPETVEPPAPRGASPLGKIPTISFLFAGAMGSMPVQWWGPRSMSVAADEALPIFAELEARLRKEQLQRRPFAREMSFTCRPGVDAHVAVTRPLAFVESFRCSDDDDELLWEPMIATADTGMSLELTPTVAGDVITMDFRLQLRDIVDIPIATSRLATRYGGAFGKRMDPLAATVQAPLFSEHVFAGKRDCRSGDAFLVFGTNTTAKDQVLLTLIQVDKSDAQ